MQPRPSPFANSVEPSQIEHTESPQFEQLSLFQSSELAPVPLQKRQRWRGWGMAIALFGAIGLGIGGWSLVSANNGGQSVAQSQHSPSNQGGPPARPVEVTTLKNGQAQTSIQLLGQVEASQQSTLKAQTGGIIQALTVQTGDRVTEGMTIAILDDTEQQLTVAQSQAELAQERSQLARLEQGTRPEIIAQREAAVQTSAAQEEAARDQLQRMRDLVKAGAFPQRQLVEAQTALDGARSQRLEAEAALAEALAGPIPAEIEAQQANVIAATAQLNQSKLGQQRTEIMATSSGIVKTRQVSVGDLVEPGSEIATLIADDHLDVFLEIPENLSGQIAAGTPVELSSRALPSWKRTVSVTALVPSADAASRRQRVRVELHDPPQGLLAGMAVEAKLVRANPRGGFVVSRDVLTQHQGQWQVFTIVNDQAKAVPVEIITDMGETVAIAGPNLKSGQVIVARGGDGLKDGMGVKIVGK